MHEAKPQPGALHTHTPKSYFLSVWLSADGTFQTARLEDESTNSKHTVSHVLASSSLPSLFSFYSALDQQGNREPSPPAAAGALQLPT